MVEPLTQADHDVLDTFYDREQPMARTRCEECDGTGDCPQCEDLAVSNCPTCNDTGRCPHCNSDSVSQVLR